MLDIEKSWNIDAPRKQIYDQWVSENTVIAPAIRIEIEPEVGGKYLLVSRFGDDESIMEGIY